MKCCIIIWLSQLDLECEKHAHAYFDCIMIYTKYVHFRWAFYPHNIFIHIRINSSKLTTIVCAQYKKSWWRERSVLQELDFMCGNMGKVWRREPSQSESNAWATSILFSFLLPLLGCFFLHLCYCLVLFVYVYLHALCSLHFFHFFCWWRLFLLFFPVRDCCSVIVLLLCGLDCMVKEH